METLKAFLILITTFEGESKQQLQGERIISSEAYNYPQPDIFLDLYQINKIMTHGICWMLVFRLSYSTVIHVRTTSLTLATLMPCSNNQSVQNNISSHLLWLLGNLLITGVHLSEAALSILACCLVITVTVGSQYLKPRHCHTLETIWNLLLYDNVTAC